MKKDLISVSDMSPGEVSGILKSALELKKAKLKSTAKLKAQTIALIFEKPSLRTRVTFEVGMTQMGGHAVYLESRNIGPGNRESVPDIGRNLERWVQGIVARTFSHDTIEQLAKYARVPVINALSDLEHPCQALACMLTIKEKLKTLKGKKLVYIGDGNNVANSLALICPKVGMDFTVCSPAGYEPDPDIMQATRAEAKKRGTSVRQERQALRAVKNAAVIYTDTWASMGQETEHAKRVKVFKHLQVNEKLMAAAPEMCLVTHCLPAHRGEEITDAVLDGPQSVCFDEAENRLHVQKAVLLKLLTK